MANKKRKIYVIDYSFERDPYYKNIFSTGCNKGLVRQTPYYPFNIQIKHSVGNWIYKWGNTNSNFKQLEIINVK